MVVVKPESSKTYNKILDFIEEIVSTTVIVTCVRCFEASLLELLPIAFLAVIWSKLVLDTSSVKMWCALCTLVSAFPVEIAVEIVLQKFFSNKTVVY